MAVGQPRLLMNEETVTKHRVIWGFGVLVYALGGCTVQVDATDYIKKCKPGAQRCSGQMIEECTSSGKEYEIIQVCGQGEQCVDAVCTTGGLPGGTSDTLPGDGVTTPDLTGPPPQVEPGPPTPSKLGNTISITGTFSIEQSLVGGFVDVGFCSGTTASYPPELGAVCRGSLFFRVAHESSGLTGTMYRHEVNAAPVALSSPINLDPTDVFVFEFKDYQAETPTNNEYIMTAAFTAAFAKVGAAVTATLPKGDMAVFGLWNYKNTGDDEEALSGELANVTLSLDGGVPMTTAEFASLSGELGDVVTSPATSDGIGFYFSAAEPGAVFFALPWSDPN